MKHLNGVAVGFFVALIFIAVSAAVLLTIFPEVLELYHTIDSYLQ